MEAPAGRMDLDVLNAAIGQHITEHYEVNGDKRFVCKKDGSEIQQTTLYVSVHTKVFGDTCAGTGEVKNLPLPYCPECEGEPKNVFTCVHM